MVKTAAVFWFYSSNYDLNVLEKTLIPILLKTNEKLSPIKRGNSLSL